MDWPLYWRLPPKDQVTPDELLDRFLDYVTSKDLELYPAQEEAILALFSGKNVILNTPTGSGKSLVALAMHFRSLALGRKSYYTCPIKALVNEKFRDLCNEFGPDQVGMITGDGAVNGQASIICCTAEILSNLALREGEFAPVDDVIMDEFHYYSDKQRGVAWQIPLLVFARSRFLLMSATLGDMGFFEDTLEKLSGEPTVTVSSNDRPVPLDFEYRETPLHETVADLVRSGLSPIYLVNFSQREAAEEAQNLLSVDFASKDEKKAIATALEGVKFQSPYGRDIQRLLRHGIGLHHAGLLPKYRTLVERLAQSGRLKVISGTDTLGVGVNVPIRTVLFTKLSKYDGEKTAILSVRDFHQISGRAGRRGFDTRGTVVAQAPAHVIENNRQKIKAGGDAKKLRKLVTKNPPPHFVMWTKESFEKLINSKPEALISRFQVTHGMLLNVVGRSGGARAMRRLIKESHDTPHQKKKHFAQAFELFRSLLDRKIVTIEPPGTEPRVRVNVTLQEDFSLNQSLALYMLDAIQMLDPQSETYALDVLTLVESILESPEMILRRQLDRLKTIKMAELKAAGVEYDERIEELEKLEFPKPNRDFIYDTFNAFSEAHPWIGQENIRPKSIAREMFENFYSFAEYIREYDLERIEGLLLRYLSEVYKVLEQTVPDVAKNEELRDISVYFGSMVAQVDSSLIEDWEKLRKDADLSTSPAAEVKVHDDKALTRVLRNEAQRFVKTLALRDFESAVLVLKNSSEWPADRLAAIYEEYLKEHASLRFDPQARGGTHFRAQLNNSRAEQTLVDPDEHNDWLAVFEFDAGELERKEFPVINLVSLGPA